MPLVKVLLALGELGALVFLLPDLPQPLLLFRLQSLCLEVAYLLSEFLRLRFPRFSILLDVFLEGVEALVGLALDLALRRCHLLLQELVQPCYRRCFLGWRSERSGRLRGGCRRRLHFSSSGRTRCRGLRPPTLPRPRNRRLRRCPFRRSRGGRC